MLTHCQYKPDLQRRLGSLFFKRTHDCVHINLQHAGRIADTTPVQGHVDDLFLNAGLVSPLGIVKLKTTLAGFAFVAGPPVRLVAAGADSFTSDSVLVGAVAARNNESYHPVETQSPRSSHDLL